MRKKTKKIIGLSLLAGAFACMAIACGGDDGTTKPVGELTLTGKTEDVAYGSIYKINTVVTDSLGNKYDMGYQVKTADGEKVAVAGERFSITDKGGYVIEYWVEFDGEVLKKTDTLTVKALGDPMITIYGLPQTVFYASEYVIPDVSVKDIYDGELEPTIEVYKKGVETDVFCGEYEAGESFLATEAGEYYLKASATNSANTVGSNALSFYVRERMKTGEYDNFDEESIQLQYQSAALIPQLSAISYKDEFRGREGLLHLNFTARSDNTSYLHLYGKGIKTDYTDYDYIAITMYVEGEENCLYNLRLGYVNTTERIENLTYNAWKTYYVPATALRNHWSTESRITLNCLPYKNCNVYIDRIYLANAAEITMTDVREENGMAKPAFTSDVEESVDYTVWYEDSAAALMLKNEEFVVDSVGTYVIEPTFSTGDVVYVGEPYVYQSTEGSAGLELNEYDAVITPDMTEFTLPQASLVNADGYTLKAPKITFTDYDRATNEMSFDKTRKGVFTFEFTATKAGAKTLTAKARVKTGSYAENEVFTFSDADAMERISVRINKTGGEILTENLPDGMSGSVFHLPITANAEYLNIMPSATYEEIAKADFVKVQVVISGTLKAGQTFPATKFTFGSSAFTVTKNTTLYVSVTSQEFLKEYYRLHTDVNSQVENIMGLTTTIASFEELHLYVTDITRETVSYEENEMFTPGNGYTLIGVDGSNKKTAGFLVNTADIPSGYSGAVEKISATKTVNITSPWTLDEIKGLKSKGYATLDFKIYVEDAKDGTAGQCATNDGLLYRHSQTNGNTKKYYLLTAGEWLDFSVSIDDVIAEMEESGTNELMLLSKLKQITANYDGVYVSGLTFSK